MADVTQELMFELMKRIHADIGDVKQAQRDLQADFINMRGTMVAMQSDIHNIYGMLYRQDDRMERIEKRLDLREFNEGHIVNALHISFNDLTNRLDKLEKYRNKTIIPVCRTGQQSSVAASKLKKSGFGSWQRTRENLWSWT